MTIFWINMVYVRRSLMYFLFWFSSKDEDFYSSLALAAEDDNVSDVSEADVNQMAKSIAVSSA